MRRLGLTIIGTAVLCVLGAAGFKMSTNSNDAFHHSVTIDRPAAEVWRALTRKQDVDRYYLAPLGADITAVGGDLYYGTETNKLIVGKVVAIGAPRELAHTFRFADGSDAPETLVTYRLAASGDTTRLSVEHSGYQADSQHYADIAMGWPIILGGLKAHLEGIAATADGG